MGGSHMKSLITSCLLFNLAQGQDSPHKTPAEEAIATRAIHSLISSLTHLATSNLNCREQNDCHLIPIGFLPCGGPAAYLTTSAHNHHRYSIDVLQEKLLALSLLKQSTGDDIRPCPISQPELTCTDRQCKVNRPRPRPGVSPAGGQ